MPTGLLASLAIAEKTYTSMVGNSIRQLRADAVLRLAEAGVANPENDVAWLMASAIGIERKALTNDTELADEQISRFQVLLARRQAREPLQHILGDTGFRYLTLKVGPGVFVPRPETEVLVGLALAAIRDYRGDNPRARITVVDLCTGSGAIALAIAIEAGHADVFGVEADEAAVRWAELNVSDHEDEIAAAESRVTILRAGVGDLPRDDLALLPPRGTVHIVTCNPPYIPDAAIPRYREVREFDPPSALYGGPDGLDVVRPAVDVAAELLQPSGSLLIEHGDAQGEAAGDLGVPAVLRAHGDFIDVQDHYDLTERPRVTAARRR